MAESTHDDFPQPVAELIAEAPLMELGPGRRHINYLAALDALTPALLMGTSGVADSKMAQCCISGLWLLYDFLSESHTLSQGLHTTEGNYWHALMHRREPDAWNSKYWFDRVGQHPIYPNLATAAREECAALGMSSGDFRTLATARSWNAGAFVDLCEEVRGSGHDGETLCRRIQQREWKLLFHYCWQMAGRR